MSALEAVFDYSSSGRIDGSVTGPLGMSNRDAYNSFQVQVSHWLPDSPRVRPVRLCARSSGSSKSEVIESIPGARGELFSEMVDCVRVDALDEADTAIALAAVPLPPK